MPIEDIPDSHLGLLVREVKDIAAAPGLSPPPEGPRISALLLPPPLLRRHWDGDPDTLAVISNLFQVSLSAMTSRASTHYGFGRVRLHYEFR